MKAIEHIHERYIHTRRIRVLSETLIPWIQPNACVLDVGCGDGLLSQRIALARSDLTLEGTDVLIRNKTHIPVKPFDGWKLPYSDNQFDIVMFVDVLHHTNDPMALLFEAARVASVCVLIKDHLLEGFLAGPTLSFMDWIGNAHHQVALPHNYWPLKKWEEAFTAANLKVNQWTQKIPLYPMWAGWLFGRSLHFAARLEKGKLLEMKELNHGGTLPLVTA